MRRWMNAWAIILAALMFALPREALAGRFLFVSDTNTDNNIPTVLRGDGHTVDVVINDYNATTMNNTRLQMPIGAYDAVFWSATGGGSGSVHTAATITNLTTYVTAGGRVFVTGYDSIASPTDPPLIGFLGGTGSIDVPGNPGPVINVANALTTGVVDIRGVTPTGGASDRDSLTGAMAGTVIVVPTMGSTTEGQWILRTLGTGLIAYVSNGDPGSSSAHVSWTTTTPIAAGAYNAALRNFARSSSRANVLFVSDVDTDNNIPTVLRADGHNVTVVTNDYNTTSMGNTRLQGSFAGFDVVVWSATGGGSGSVHAAATITNLTTYVTAGGRVFVTGYDSIASPTDPPLIGFLGGTGSIDVPGNPGPVINVANALTTGVVDIRGVTPTGGASDRDSLTGAMAGTVIVVPTMGSTTEGQWILRTLGTGLIAYVSNGDPGSSSAHVSWTTTTPIAAGAYNAALRNFVFAAAGRGTPAPTPLPNGSACMAGSECMSSFCVDGVCCNNACPGGTTDCQACAMAAGAPSNGTCAPVAMGRTCRASTGMCDAAETCNGTSMACPADGFAAAGTACRPATGVCDVAETCTGMSAACPEDRTAMDGTACNDTMTCNGAETCRGGMCRPGTAPDCDDRDPCTVDMCAEPMGCGHAPIPGCGVADAGADVPDSAMVADVEQPDVVTPDVVTPDVVTPDVVIPDVAQPDVATTDVVTPDVVTSDAKVEDVATTDAAQPDVPAADVVTTDAAVTDAAVTDAAVTDASATDADTTDADTTDGGFIDQPGGGSSGCGCAVPGRSERSPASIFALVGLAALLGARRRRDSR